MPTFRVIFSLGFSCLDVVARTASEAETDVERELHDAIFNKGMFPYAFNIKMDDDVIEISHAGYSAKCDIGKCPHETNEKGRGGKADGRRNIRKFWDLPDDERKAVGDLIKRRLEAETEEKGRRGAGGRRTRNLRGG